MKFTYKHVLCIGFAVHLFLLFIYPISMFGDGIARYLINAEQILNLNLNFHTWPVYPSLLAFAKIIAPDYFFQFKLISFFAFAGILFLLPFLFKKFNLTSNEKIIASALFVFAPWALLLSASVLPDMLLAFLALVAFLSLTKYLESNRNTHLALAFASIIFLALAKQTALFILFGLFLFVWLSKINTAQKLKASFPIILGVFPVFAWMLKNFLNPNFSFFGGSKTFALPSDYSVFRQMADLAYSFWAIDTRHLANIIGDNASIIIGLALFFIFAGFFICVFWRLRAKIKGRPEYVGLLAPLFFITLFFIPFFFMKNFWDAGRNSFPLWIFVIVAVSKFICDFKHAFAKKFFSAAIMLFIITSAILAFGMIFHIKQIDGQVYSLAEQIKIPQEHVFTTDAGYADRNNWQATFLEKGNKLIPLDKYEKEDYDIIFANDDLVKASLVYYAHRTAYLNENLVCGYGSLLFESKNLKAYYMQNEIYVCRS